MTHASPSLRRSRRTSPAVAAFTLLATSVAFAAANPGARAATTIAPVLPSGAAKASYIRLHNPTGTAGSATLTLRNLGAAPILGTWPVTVPAGAAVQISAREIEAGARVASGSSTQSYALGIVATFVGFAQQVVWNAAAGRLTNMSTCGPARAADAGSVANVHTGLIPAYPSVISLTNTGTTPQAATLTIRDSRTGEPLGTWSSAAFTGVRDLFALDILAAARLSDTPGRYHVNMTLDNAFTGTLRHLVTQADGASADMGAKCNIGPESAQ